MTENLNNYIENFVKMETLYLLIMSIWNGTILMKTEYSVYDTKELAEQVRDKLKKENTEDMFRISYEIREVIKYNKNKT